MAATARRVVGPNTRDWYASGGLIVWGPIERIGLVTPPGYRPTALVPDWLVGGAALDRAIGSLIPELGRRVHGEIAYTGLVGRMVSFLARVPKEP